MYEWKRLLHCLRIDEHAATAPAIADDVVDAFNVEATFVRLHNVDGEGPRRGHSDHAAHDSQEVRPHLVDSALDAYRLAIACVAVVAYALRPERKAVDAERRQAVAFRERAWF